MALSNVQTVTVLLVLGILLLVILYNNVVAARSHPKGAKAEGNAQAPPVNPLLCKFARHEGNVVGESVALEGDRLVLKQAGVFKSVPVGQVREEGGELVVTGAVDWAKAMEEGAAWHAKNRAAVDDAVSGPLTRSEDVKAPAIESVQKREG